MDRNEFYRVETELAFIVLKQTRCSKNGKLAEAARNVLGDKQLFETYVKTRVRKKRKAKRKEKFLTYWKNVVKMFKRRSFI